MTNREKYDRAFVECLKLSPPELANARRGETRLWDSIGHLGLVERLGVEFGIRLEPADVLDFTSYVQGLELLEKKYQISPLTAGC